MPIWTSRVGFVGLLNINNNNNNDDNNNKVNLYTAPKSRKSLGAAA